MEGAAGGFTLCRRLGHVRVAQGVSHSGSLWPPSVVFATSRLWRFLYTWADERTIRWANEEQQRALVLLRARQRAERRATRDAISTPAPSEGSGTLGPGPAPSEAHATHQRVRQGHRFGHPPLYRFEFS